MKFVLQHYGQPDKSLVWIYDQLVVRRASSVGLQSTTTTRRLAS